MRAASVCVLACAIAALMLATPIVSADVHIVVKDAGGPKKSAINWQFVPQSYGIWRLQVENDGLRYLAIEVFDNTTGVPESVFFEKLRFSDLDAYPTGTVFSRDIVMAPSRIYEITAIPNGPRGASAVMTDVFNPPGLQASIVPPQRPIEIDAGSVQPLSVVVTKDGGVVDPDMLRFMWSVTPLTLGSFDLRARQMVNFTAGIQAGVGTVSCQVTYFDGYGNSETTYAQASVVVMPPYLDSVSISPSSKTLGIGESAEFIASALSSVGLPILNAYLTWSIEGLSDIGLNATTGPSVYVTAGTTYGEAILHVSASYMGEIREGSAHITVGSAPARSVDYYWYDMFNCSFGSWWDVRWQVYGWEQVMSYEYPYWFRYGSPDHYQDMTNMRLGITGRNMDEINMNDRPEFLPFLSPSERGGTAVIDWYMQYLTAEEMQRYPDSTAAWNDGWVVSLNGTVTLDKQAAKSVLNVTEVGYANFDTWWTVNKLSVANKYVAWLQYEGGLSRLDIYPAYEYVLTFLSFDLTAEKVGEYVVLRYDVVSWGMEILMARWLHEAFMPTEWYFEDMTFHATIGPETTDLDMTAVGVYSVYAWEGTNDGRPCWAWEAELADYVPSTFLHPHSDFDSYKDLSYVTKSPGSPRYGQMIGYDYTPGVWNLSEGETLRFTYPAGEVLFRQHVEPGVAINYTDSMRVEYLEPDEADMPWVVDVDNLIRTIEFVGPADFWSWGLNQTSKPELRSEWDRLGILPHGLPYIEFECAHPAVVNVSHFLVEMPAHVKVGDQLSVKVTAMTPTGTVFADYAGVVIFSSTDPDALLPPIYQFGFPDQGIHVFDGISFWTEGLVTVTVEDVTHPWIFGTAQLNITAERIPEYFSVEVYHRPAIGISEDVKLTVYDQYDSVILDYTGTVHFSSNRSAEVHLPQDYTFTPSDMGVKMLADAVTFLAVGWFMISVTDTVYTSATGLETEIRVASLPEMITFFELGVSPYQLVPGQATNVVLTAYNQYEERFSRYSGTVHFSSNASPQVLLPEDCTFNLSDAGSKTLYAQLTYLSAGVFDLVAVDTLIPVAQGIFCGIVVYEWPLPSSQQTSYRMYDLFEQPWGQWWYWRYPSYQADIVLNSQPHKNTLLYNPDLLGKEGIIQAPYRWNITASNVTAWDVHNPIIMPTLGTPNITGADATVDVRFEYLDNESFANYWKPYWGVRDSIMNLQRNDGWYLGTVITATMNRQAAEEWIGLPQSEPDPLDWWTRNFNENKWAYFDAFELWIDDQGNNIYDIFCGYEFPYAIVCDEMKLFDLGGGLVKLEIGHVNWGYEVLLTRWLAATGLCFHEPWYEDGTLHVEYNEISADIEFDAVAHHSLTAVKAHDGVSNEPAWAWEPLLIDYIPSLFAFHPSQFDPWASLTYTSLNAVDPKFGGQVAYQSGLANLSLGTGQTLVIQLPVGSDVLGYLGEKGEYNAILKIISAWPAKGDYSSYTSRMVNGSMSLGYYYSGGPDIASMYDAGANTITMVGPLLFDNVRDANGTLLRGAPYIEFNVTGVGDAPLPVLADNIGPSTSVVDLSAQALLLAAISVVALLCYALLDVVRRRER